MMQNTESLKSLSRGCFTVSSCSRRASSWAHRRTSASGHRVTPFWPLTRRHGPRTPAQPAACRGYHPHVTFVVGRDGRRLECWTGRADRPRTMVARSPGS